ncbi:hypothetical protein VNI00_018694 [Paramarasmius palmivorus]|uniref:Uncharacterized protein n=1 Tax=Paramarasmius palmivorus TaxID=297713 RepID=A0AAW0AUQ6_9AGAR
MAGKKKSNPRAVVIEDTSEDEDDARQRLRKALNEIHWHSGRIHFFQTELVDHIRAAERAAYEAEEAFEDLNVVRRRSRSPSLPRFSLSSKTSSHYSSALSRLGSEDSSDYGDSSTEELIRNVQLSPDGTPVPIAAQQPTPVQPSHMSAATVSQVSKVRNCSTPSSPTVKRALPARSPPVVQSPTAHKRARKGPKGGYLVLNGKDNINGVFASWSSAASLKLLRRFARLRDFCLSQLG